MKNILIGIAIGIAVMLLPSSNKVVGSNTERIAEGDFYQVYKAHDGDTKCYVVLLWGAKNVSISCVRVK
jgi:hypothetical protein